MNNWGPADMHGPASKWRRFHNKDICNWRRVLIAGNHNMCFIFIAPLFEGDWIYQIYQYTSHSLQDHLEVRTNKPVVTRLKNHMCSLLHIWILLRQPTTWMIDKYNCTHLSHWQIQLHTLDKYYCTHLINTIVHLTNAIGCTCLTDTRQAISCF